MKLQHVSSRTNKKEITFEYILDFIIIGALDT